MKAEGCNAQKKLLISVAYPSFFELMLLAERLRCDGRDF